MKFLTKFMSLKALIKKRDLLKEKDDKLKVMVKSIRILFMFVFLLICWKNSR